MSEPVWLRSDVVLAIHNRQLTEHGGPPGIRDEGLLESALAAPVDRWRYEQSGIPSLGACYAFHLAGNHPFIDGNKRTGAVAALVFLDLNGVEINAPEGSIYDLTMSVAAGKADKSDIAQFLCSHVG